MTLANLDRYARQLLDRAERLEIPQGLEDRFAHYRNDPVAFATEVLAVEQLPPYQQAVLRDVAAYERTAWVGGHATGKSHLAAVLIAWFLLTRPGCRIVITSPTHRRQTGLVVFSRLRTLLARAPEPLPIETYMTRCQVSGHSEWSAEGVPSTKPENIAGLHSDRMLILVDEAKAVDRPVYEELHGCLASAHEEARLVLLSTAGPASGYFYEAFERKAELWRLHRTPSTESPFAVGYSERMLQECLGESDPVYRMRVLAEFAEDVEGALIPLASIYAAVDREPEHQESAPVVLGCDIARFGDDRSVVALRRGNRIVDLTVWRGADTMQSADRIEALMQVQGATARVDSIGLGAGTLDQLRRRTKRARGVNVAERSQRPDTFTNVRAELAWKLRGRFLEERISIPDDPALVSELAALRYQYDSKGRIQLEAKAAAKARLGRSPDLADAVMLSFADEVLVQPVIPRVNVYTYSPMLEEEQPRGEPHEVFRHDELGKHRMGRRFDAGVW